MEYRGEQRAYCIPMRDFLESIHCYTEVVHIKAVGADVNGKYHNTFYLASDVFRTAENGFGRGFKSEEYHTLISLYGDVPVWNVHAEIERQPSGAYIPVITGNVYYKDIHEIYQKQIDDIRKKARREYEKRRREAKKNGKSDE